ncbi:hypothetical protein ACIQYS_19945 [Psychrobacillus sp. NPDC096426]|uniref:hypothetical protein n=1 Tax=Psychrobacillus sp. NPDC096426 TaxID=3364491 RepID=UPI0038170DE0
MFMPNNIDYILQAAIRSMEETIIPAVDIKNPLAQEQVTTITQLLKFMRERIPYVQQRDWLELKIYADMTEKLWEDIVVLLPDQAESTLKVRNEVDVVLTTPTPEPGLLEKLAEKLRTTLSDLIRYSHDQEEQQRNRIESVILLDSKRVLDLHRAWLVPTGLVADSDLVPDLERQLYMEQAQPTFTR